MSLGLGVVDRHSIFAETLFTRKRPLASSPYIKAMHPKSEISPEPTAILRILGNGWVGQTKIHGHRAQIHISADPNEAIIAYTRQGTRHKLALIPKLEKELRRLFTPDEKWNVIDTEWLKPQEKIFVFDFLKYEGETLRSLTFPERWKKLPTAFISPCLSVLPLLTDLSACTKILASPSPTIEGLVFKSSTSTGFSDSSIVRCRKRQQK